MNKIFLLFLSVIITVSFAAVPTGELGPIRACRCYSRTQSAFTSIFKYSSSNSGEAELCHCLPASDIETTMSHMNMKIGMHQSMNILSRSGSAFFGSTSRVTEPCGYGWETHGKYTVDDTAELKMCGNSLSYGSLNQLINIDLTSSYACGDYFFSLRNDQYSSGIAMYITVGGHKFVAVGSNSPPLPSGVRPLAAYAQWTYGSCDGVYPTNSAVYVSTLVGTNDAFKTASNEGAYPLGVQDGNVYENGLQCIRIENPACEN